MPGYEDMPGCGGIPCCDGMPGCGGIPPGGICAAAVVPDGWAVETGNELEGRLFGTGLTELEG